MHAYWKPEHSNDILCSDIKVESSNGDISLKRTAGKTAHLTTGGGGIALDVLQVASGHLHSGGGSITIGQVCLSADTVIMCTE